MIRTPSAAHSRSRPRMCALVAPLLASVVLAATSATASPVSLSDAGLNSSVTIDTTSQSGISNWTIDGVDQLSQMWFWYRIGAGPEQSIDTLQHNPAFDRITYNTNFSPGDDTLLARFTSPGNFELQLRVSLNAGAIGSGTAGLVQQISVTNLRASSLPFSLFQFVDFDIASMPSVASPFALHGDNETLAWTSVSPGSSFYEANSALNLLGSLNDGSPTTLGNIAGGAGDSGAFAYQWNVNIPGGGTFLLTSSQTIIAVPEPSSVVLLGLGSLVAGAFALRRRTRSAA